MTNALDQKLRKFVNSSGFPLQIKIKHTIEISDDQKWGVVAQEHPWENPISGESGFIDLILEYFPATQILVVECKRVRDSQWIFLVPSTNQKKYSHAKSWTTYLPKWFGWLDRDL